MSSSVSCVAEREAQEARREPRQQQPAQDRRERLRLDVRSGRGSYRLGRGVRLLGRQPSLLDREVCGVPRREDVVVAAHPLVLVDRDEAAAVVRDAREARPFEAGKRDDVIRLDGLPADEAERAFGDLDRDGAR